MKTILKRAVVLFALTMMVSGSAQARWYIGVGVGATDSTSGFGFDTPPTTESDDSGFAWSGFGGYDFGPNFAFEFGYSDLGDDYETFNLLGNDELTQWKAAAIDLTLVGRLKIHDRVHLYGRLGLAYWDVELHYGEPDFGSSGSDTDVDAVIGAGFEWQPGRALGVRFEWKQFQNVGDEVKTVLPPPGGGRLQLNGHDVSVLGIGLTWRFQE